MRYGHDSMLPERAFMKVGGRMTLEGGDGGGSAQPTTSTTQTSNIPEYARPYVETMLGTAEQQIYNTDESGNVTGFKPYQPYSTNPQDYVAPFSPLQQQAQTSAYGLTTPGQFGAATGLAGASGLGSLGIAGQAVNAGNQYAMQATNPYATAAYMSPYMQNVVDYQKSQALRDYNIGQQLRKAQAVGQGAFGGSRQAIMESEAQRALGTQIGGIEAQGAQQAFQNAQQAQQFGANLGLQGLQSGLQGLGQANTAAANLGQLGTSQLAAQQGIIGTQAQQGALQQQNQQQIINQAIQNYATAQQYPQQQLAFMSGLLHGLPLQSQTTQGYQAAPSTISQLSGLGLTGAAMYGMAKKKGGVIKEGDGLEELGMYHAMKGNA